MVAPMVTIQWIHNIRSSRIIEKLQRAPYHITMAYREAYLGWHEKYLIPEMLREVRTGKGDFPASNMGRWRDLKARVYGINHSLGILSGMLYAGVRQGKVQLRSNKNKATITARTRFRQPRHLPFVVRGTRQHRAYDFIGSSLKRTTRYLKQEMDISLSKRKDIIGA